MRKKNFIQRKYQWWHNKDNNYDKHWRSNVTVYCLWGWWWHYHHHHHHDQQQYCYHYHWFPIQVNVTKKSNIQLSKIKDWFDRNEKFINTHHLLQGHHHLCDHDHYHCRHLHVWHDHHHHCYHCYYRDNDDGKKNCPVHNVIIMIVMSYMK